MESTFHRFRDLYSWNRGPSHACRDFSSPFREKASASSQTARVSRVPGHRLSNRRHVFSDTRLDRQVAASRAINDEELETVASIAGRFLKRSRKANHRLLLQQSQLGAGSGESGADGGGGGSGDNSHGTKNVIGQGWVRQRIDVKTDEWHRVRALPMYCSSGRATPVGWGGETSRGRQGVL